ncbi:MAG: hypothetical protein BXU00_01230 [Candidatus Nanoclepta minutus]|uniref:Steroid 5-alpha reductase C-terminal domain-containing protein n=1 Tax=Candidatus Nanoclepta minutus TaxID=1940235 RepID=A0A397WMS7_9ARCH|nr:MAG: hypothetical protein BXU00_01230 [Candidatus Nanoclepta minutus]
MAYIFYNPLLDALIGAWAVVLAFGIYRHVVNIKSGEVSYEDRRLILYFFAMYALSFFVIYFFNYLQGSIEAPLYLYYFGILLMALGIVFGVWSIVNYSEYWSFSISIFKDQKIKDKGPNAIVRHPFYLSNFLFFLGYSMSIGTILSIIGAFIALSFLIYMANMEERYYLEKLGDSYKKYAEKVRYKIIPFIY